MDTPGPLVETVPISQLYCSPTNPRRNDDAVPHVGASLRRFGWQQPIVARRSGEVVAGNTRLKAAQELGMTEVVLSEKPADADSKPEHECGTFRLPSAGPVTAEFFRKAHTGGPE